MTVEGAILLIESAHCALDLFSSDKDKRQKLYRQLLIVHPDKNPGNPRAAAAFARMSGWYSSLNGSTSAKVKVGKWELVRPLVKGDICDLHIVTAGSENAVLKIGRSPADNDLVEREAAALKRLKADTRSVIHYVPKLLDSFEASGRRVNVLPLVDDCYSLAQMIELLPGGIDFKHVVWMGNRLFSALGYCHRNGIIHGAVTPDHLLYRPTDHGLVLVDFCCSVQFPDDAGHIPLVVKRWEHLYPPEVKRKDAYPPTDIYMAAGCLRLAAKGQPIPSRQFRALLDWCQAESPFARPGDAWELVDKWKEAALAVYGPPQFVKLEMPVQ